MPRPVFSGDEVGHLMLARYLAGQQFSVLADDSYYVGWPVLLAPLAAAFADPEQLYRAVLVSQVVVAVVGMVALYLLGRALGAAPAWSLLGATLVSVSPSRSFAAGYALPEMSIGTLLFAVLALTAWDDRRPRSWYPWVVVPLALLAPLMHPRMAPLALVVVLHVVVRALRRPGRPRVLHVLAFLGALLAFAVAWVAAAEVQALMFPVSERTLRPDLSLLLSGTGAGVVVGQVWYGAVALWGLAAVGAVVVVGGAFTGLRHGRTDVWSVLVLSSAGVFALGVVNLLPFAAAGSRLDYWVYGRYLDPVWAVLGFVGVLALPGLSAWGRRASAALLLAVVAAGGLVLSPKPVATDGWIPLNVAGLTPYPWRQTAETVVPWGPASVAALGALLVLVALAGVRDPDDGSTTRTGGLERSGRTSDPWPAAGVVSLLLVVVLVALPQQRATYERFDFSYRQAGVAIHEPVRTFGPVQAPVLLDREAVGEISGNLYAWHLSDRDVRPVQGSSLTPDDVPVGSWVLAGRDAPAYLPAGSLRVLGDPGEGDTLWVTPGPALDRTAPFAAPAADCRVGLRTTEGPVRGVRGERVDLRFAVRNLADGALRADGEQGLRLAFTWRSAGQDQADTVGLPRDLLLEDELDMIAPLDIPTAVTPGAGALTAEVVRADGSTCGPQARLELPSLVAP